LITNFSTGRWPGFLGGLWLCTSTGVLHEGKAGVDVALHLAKRLSTLRLEDATASVQKDKDMPPGCRSEMMI